MSNRPLLREFLFCSDLPNATPPVPIGRDDMKTDRAIILLKGHGEMVPVLQKSSLLDDDDDFASMFTTVHCTRVSTRTFVSIPSSNASKQRGQGGQSGASG